MLSIGKLGAGQHSYYLGKVAEGAEDYYSGEAEAEGYWLGEGAVDLGLQGKVEPEQLVAMLTGRNPVNGEPLGLKSAPGREPVPGIDLTFSAPKSVSLTWALGGHPVSGQVKEAHAAAVAEALGYLQRQACWTRRGRGGHEFVPGNGFLAAAYLHRSSRAGDPQLHTHVLIANATKGPDGRWSRLYHPAIYNHAKTASYIYEAHLRHELTQRLGVRWQPVLKGIADIAGFTPAQLQRFSTRRAEILAVAGEGASARAMQIATLATRKAKDRDLTSESLREAWRVKGAEVGLERETIAERLGHERPGPTLLSALQVERSLTAHVSHFDRRATIQAVADNLPHGAPAGEVEQLADAFLTSESVIGIAESPKGARFTTQRIWALEQRALAAAERMRRTTDRVVIDPILVSRVLDARPSLKADQRAMVSQLLGAGRALEVVIGEAGTGKTYATVAAAEGWAAGSHELLVAAPTWRAANVLRSEGLDATSIARLLANLDRKADAGQAPMRPGSVLLIDEAGMVDSATLARLIDHAQAVEAKLVLIGDPAQLGEIEAGGLFAALASRCEPVVLDEVIRHHHKLDREGAKRIREGEGREALDLYRSAERVIVAADPEARREEMVSDWWQSFGQGEDALMVAKRNAEVEQLNALARKRMRAEGRLGGAEIEVGEARFAPGDQVITRINDHKANIYNRERWRIESVDPGSGAVVLDAIDTQRRVCVDSVYLERVTSYGDPAIQHAYAATTYQAQGATVDRAYVMADPSMDRQELYVAASRSREETFFYATPEVQPGREEIAPASPHTRQGLEHIAEAAERDGSQSAAHDEALRSSLGQLSTEELTRRRAELRAEAGAERHNEESRQRLAEEIARAERNLDRIAAQAERVGELPRRQRRPELERLQERADRSSETADRLEAEQRSLASVEHRARAEAAVIDHLLAERQRAELTALRISPPPYIVKELGERPSDLRKRASWDRAAEGIEGYRKQNGVRDRDSALGPHPARGRERARWEAQQRRLRESQRRLGVEQARSREAQRGAERSLGIGR
jgi:conjugative relaxase-like TrwC/TraI family protein